MANSKKRSKKPKKTTNDPAELFGNGGVASSGKLLVNHQTQVVECTCGVSSDTGVPHYLTYHAPTPDKHLVGLFNCPRCLSSYIVATDHPPVKTMFTNLPDVTAFYRAMEALEKSGWLAEYAVYQPENEKQGYNPKGSKTDG